MMLCCWWQETVQDLFVFHHTFKAFYRFTCKHVHTRRQQFCEICLSTYRGSSLFQLCVPGNIDFITSPLTDPPTDSHQLLQPPVTTVFHFINRSIIPDEAYQDWIDSERECVCKGLWRKIIFFPSVKDSVTFLTSSLKVSIVCAFLWCDI